MTCHAWWQLWQAICLGLGLGLLALAPVQYLYGRPWWAMAVSLGLGAQVLWRRWSRRCWRHPWWGVNTIRLIKRGEVLLQQPVDKDITTSHPTEEEALSRIVQEVSVASGHAVIIPEAQTEHQMLETRPSPVSEPSGEPDELPGDQPEAQPAD